MSGKKIYRFLSYLPAALVLAIGSALFFELFLYVGRHSFFTFQFDFLVGFMPWNSHINMYPGQPYNLRDLAIAFSGQFYSGWGVIVYTVLTGLLFCALLTFIGKIFLLKPNRKRSAGLRDRSWKKGVLFILPSVGACVFLFCQMGLAFSCLSSYWGIRDYKLGRILMKTERLVSEQRYGEALQTADRYWFSHPCSIDDVVTGKNSLYAGMPQTEILFRQDLAAYTRVALLGSHRLNDDFFNYYRVPEIYGQMDNAGAPAGTLASVFRNQIIGNHTAAYSQIMNVMETEGLSYSMLEQSVFSTLVCHQYGLADKYIRLLNNTLFYHRQARRYREVSMFLQHPENNRTELSPEARHLSETILKARDKTLTDYIYSSGISEPEARELWRQRPSSLENLEYISLFDLLYKRTDRVMAHIGDYLRLSGQEKPPYRLPSSWQEMLLVEMAEHQGQLPTQTADLVRDLAWNNAIRKQIQLFYQERERLRQGNSSPWRITQGFGHTFAYNYYYSRFVSPQQAGDGSTLAH